MTRLSTPEQLCGHHPQGPHNDRIAHRLDEPERRTTLRGHATGLSTHLSDVLSDVWSAKFAVAGTLTQ